ncbi:MAG: ATP-binding protein [Nocardioides sp.]
MEELAESGQLWRLTLQHSPVGMTLVAPDGRFLAVNDALCRMLGYDAEALRASTFQQITHPDDLALGLELLEDTLAGGRSSYRIVKRYFHADGHIVWGDLSVALLRNPDGTPIHFISQIVDITAQRASQDRLAEARATIDRQRRMTEAVYDTVDVGLILIDSAGRYEHTNRRHRDFMTLAFPDGHAGLAGQLGDVFAEDGVTRLPREHMPTYRAANQEEFDDVRAWIGADPLTRRAVSVSARSVRDPDGTFAGAAMAYKDVTDYLRALEVKDEFVASVSHELRTPLTAVLGHLELLADAQDLPEELATRIEVIERNAVRLRHLVSDLLHVAQGPEGGLSIVRTESDLSSVVTDAVEAARPAATAAGLMLESDTPDRLPALVDPGRIRQVVDNLVSNAVKYSRPGGSVHVRLALVADRVELTVADSGMGIDPADLDRLFTRFFRGAQAQELHIPGTGLGLHIVRSIVDAHGGHVTLTSEVDVGSAVTVTLPHVAL